MCVVTDLLRIDNILCRDDSSDSDILIARLAARAEPVAGVPASVIETAVKEREKLGTTAMGCGVALPHCRIPNARTLTLTAATLVRPILFGNSSGENVYLVFLIVVPEGENLRYLKLLSRLSVLCSDRGIRERLAAAETPLDFISVLKETS
mgnify:CR=1 FL=1